MRMREDWDEDKKAGRQAGDNEGRGKKRREVVEIFDGQHHPWLHKSGRKLAVKRVRELLLYKGIIMEVL